MALPEYTLKDLLESGVHFGHQTHRWNPLMQEYIYGVRNGIHIIDLTQTFQLLGVALNYVQDTVSKGGSILFVGTKRQAQKPISEAAERSAQYYMNHRWLGGTLTNWKTVSNSISRLKKLDEQLSDGATGLTKKERLNLEREQSKLNASLGGIREMGGTPDLLFVIDTNKESLAIQEAKKLGIPVIAIIDTNSDPWLPPEIKIVKLLSEFLLLILIFFLKLYSGEPTTKILSLNFELILDFISKFKNNLFVKFRKNLFVLPNIEFCSCI